MLDALRIPRSVLPRIVDSSGAVGEAAALDGAPVICGIAGDQQASLVGQGCTRPGLAKATFGTGGMLDLCVGEVRPGFARRGGAGTFPDRGVAARGRKTWGVEAVMLSAGMCVEWLRDDLGIIETSADSHRVASACEDNRRRVVRARRCWASAHRCGTSAPAARSWGSHAAPATRDGARRARGRGPPRRRSPRVGRSRHRHDDRDVAGGRRDVGQPTFVGALADAVGRPVEISPVTEATTLGAAYLAGIALGVWADEAEVAAAWRPSAVVEPRTTEIKRASTRARWLAARARALATVPELSALEF